MKRSIVTMLIALVSLTMSLPMLGSAEQRRAHRSRARNSTSTSPRQTVTVPVDTLFRLRMNNHLTSRTAKVGDTFTARVTAPVAVGSVVAVPEGSTVHGRVTTVTPAARRKNGTIGVTFYKLELPSQRTYQIVGSLASLEGDQGKGGEVSQEGKVKGKSTTKRDVVFIGGGAGVGAIIGAAAGGGKGAGIGAAVGAGAGVAGALLSKGHEAEVDSGTEIGMVLDRALTVSGSSSQ